jgi:hypothetical protein
MNLALERWPKLLPERGVAHRIAASRHDRLPVTLAHIVDWLNYAVSL